MYLFVEGKVVLSGTYGNVEATRHKIRLMIDKGIVTDVFSVPTVAIHLADRKYGSGWVKCMEKNMR